MGAMDDRGELAVVTVSNDSTGIAKQLSRLEREIYGVIARVNDLDQLRDYLTVMEHRSRAWCSAMQKGHTPGCKCYQLKVGGQWIGGHRPNCPYADK